MKRFLLFALVATMFAACATDATEDVAVNIETPETLTVSFESDSRIQLQNGKTVWTKGDLVSVFYKSYDNLQFRFDGETGDRNGTLSKVSGTTGMQTMDHTIVAYPYSSDYRISLDTGGLDATLPATQYYAKDSYGVGSNIMVAQSEFTQFSLKNVCGWLKIQLKGEGQVVKSITLKGNNNEQVAGLVHINTADATLTLASSAAEEGDSSSVSGNIVLGNSISTTITLDCGEGVTLDSTAKAFYIALPPQTFKKGLTISIDATDGSATTKSTSNAITIARNTIQPMEAIEIKGESITNIPNNEIWYTPNLSYADRVITPSATAVFGANIVSNTYENGKGIIKFDGDVTLIGEYAFVSTSLTSITIPNSVTSIGEKAFGQCSSLTSITIPNGVTSIGYGAFDNCYSLTSVTIPDSVTSIGGSAFLGCRSLTSVTIGNSVTSIERSTFQSCHSLTSVTIPDSVTSIGSGAFKNCTSLTSVRIGNSVTSIEDNAFGECPSLTAFYGKIASADNRCLVINGVLNSFATSGLTEYTIPNGVTSIGSHAFSTSSLTSITIPNSVIEIEDNAFRGCATLTSITIPDSVTEIGQYAFYSCTSLTSVTIGNSVTSNNSVTSIGEWAFMDCSSLTSVTIGNSVTEIVNGTFRDCTSLTSVTITDSITSIKSSAFKNCTSLTSVYYNGDLSAWCKISFENDYANPLNNGAKLYLNGVEVTDITIPSDITGIKYYTFQGCTSLTSITIPDSVTSIGKWAFYKCSGLTSVTIPNSVTFIGSSAFYYCTSLKEVYCKPTTPPTVATSIFTGNASGRKIYVPTASVEAYKSAKNWSDYASDIVGYDF